MAGPQCKVIRLPSTHDLTAERASDETGSFAKSNMDAIKIHKVVSDIQPFAGRSREEIMEFVCYMFEMHGEPGQHICKNSVRNSNFYLIASGELLHTLGGQQKDQQAAEMKLFENDCWGLDCLFTGRDEQVSVTVTAQCRLYVLTARRFFWLCKMSAQRTMRLQRTIVNKLCDLASVRQVLEIKADSRTQTRNLNLRLLNRLLHSFRQVELPAKGEIQIDCESSEAIIVYVLAGSLSLNLDHCTSYTENTPEPSVSLIGGMHFEIGANQIWKARQDSKVETQQTLIYLVTIRLNDRSSDSTVD